MPGKYNSTGVKESTISDPIPEGEYYLKIVKTEAGITGKGDQKVVVTFEVAEGDYKGQYINYHNVTFLPKESKGAFIAVHFLKSIGEPHEGEFEWDETRWLGKYVIAHVVIEPDKKERMWNKVKKIMEPDVVCTEKNELLKKSNDDVPF